MSAKTEANSFIRLFDGFVAILFKVASWTVLILMAVMCIVMLIQVFSRYILNAPLTWPEEVSRYLFIWIVYLGAAIAFRYKAHLGMDFAAAKLPPAYRNWLERFVELLLLTFLILVIYISREVLEVTSLQKSPVIHLSLNWVYLSFPVASALMVLDLLARWMNPGNKRALEVN